MLHGQARTVSHLRDMVRNGKSKGSAVHGFRVSVALLCGSSLAGVAVLHTANPCHSERTSEKWPRRPSRSHRWVRQLELGRYQS